MKRTGKWCTMLVVECCQPSKCRHPPPTGCQKSVTADQKFSQIYIKFLNKSCIIGRNQFCSFINDDRFVVVRSCSQYLHTCHCSSEGGVDGHFSPSLSLLSPVVWLAMVWLAMITRWESCWQWEGEAATERRIAALGGESSTQSVVTYHHSPPLAI